MLCLIKHNRDKALVEGAVKIVYTRIFARLRDKTFSNIVVLNQAIQEALTDYNQYAFKGRDTSRSVLFEQLDKPALQPLPEKDYKLKKYTRPTVYKSSYVW